MVDVKLTLGSDIVLILSSKYPTEFASAPFASGVPTVKKSEVCAGGLHDGESSGGPCILFGEVHCSYAGTSETRSGVADMGRGCVAPASWAAIIRPSPPRASD